MKQFLEEYGLSVVATIVAVILVLSCTPIGNLVKNSLMNTMLGLAGKANIKLADRAYTANEDTIPVSSAAGVYDASGNFIEGEIVLSNGQISDSSFSSEMKASATRIVLPSDTESIDSSAFSGFENLKEVVFNDGLKSIGSYAFYDQKLEQVVLPASLEKIGSNAFANNTNLTSVEIKGSPAIGSYAFYGSSSLTNVDLGSITSMSMGMLGETNISRVTIPDTVNYIYGGLEFMENLQSVVFEDANNWSDGNERFYTAEEVQSVSVAKVLRNKRAYTLRIVYTDGTIRFSTPELLNEADAYDFLGIPMDTVIINGVERKEDSIWQIENGVLYNEAYNKNDVRVDLKNNLNINMAESRSAACNTSNPAGLNTITLGYNGKTYTGQLYVCRYEDGYGGFVEETVYVD